MYKTVDQKIVFNGLCGTNGRYPFSQVTVADVAALARGEKIDAGLVKRIQTWLKDRFGLHRETRERNAEADLGTAGWGVVFPRGCNSDRLEALRPLLDWRKSQAASIQKDRFVEYWGEDGYREGDSGRSFLERHNVDVGSAADPNRMPYYLLLAGGPQEIPFDFQYELDLRHAVGRLDFDTVDEYAAYAQSVVVKEKEWVEQGIAAERRATFFCPRKADRASSLMRNELVCPLLDCLKSKPVTGWRLEAVLDDLATKEELLRFLGGPSTPDFLFTACHGLVFDPSDECQREKQGALSCVGRDGVGLLDTSVAASDVSPDSSLHGLISFHFACYGAGTPQWDEFSMKGDRKLKASKPFTARLPQRLLAHHRGGALAVIGHVERAWTYSFAGARTTQIDVFEDAVRRILRGEPVGYALELFNFRHAHLSAELLLLQKRERLEPLGGNRDWELADAYCAARDACNYVVLGDPAVRFPPMAHKANAGGRSDD